MLIQSVTILVTISALILPENVALGNSMPALLLKSGGKRSKSGDLLLMNDSHDGCGGSHTLIKSGGKKMGSTILMGGNGGCHKEEEEKHHHHPYYVPMPYPVKQPEPYPVYVPVKEEVPYPVEVKVKERIPYPVHIKVKEHVPYPIHVPVKEHIPYPVPYPVKEHVPYPVHYHQQQQQQQQGGSDYSHNYQSEKYVAATPAPSHYYGRSNYYGGVASNSDYGNQGGGGGGGYGYGDGTGSGARRSEGMYHDSMYSNTNPSGGSYQSSSQNNYNYGMQYSPQTTGNSGEYSGDGYAYNNRNNQGGSVTKEEGGAGRYYR